MKLSKLIMLLLLASPLVGCQQPVDEPVKPDVVCQDYVGSYACYTNTSDRPQAYKVAYQLIDMGYQDFIIQYDKGYIEFENGEYFEEVMIGE